MNSLFRSLASLCEMPERYVLALPYWQLLIVPDERTGMLKRKIACQHLVEGNKCKTINSCWRQTSESGTRPKCADDKASSAL